jgi:hypothetical protein
MKKEVKQANQQVKYHEYESYESYVQAQTEGNVRKLHKVWSAEPNIRFIAQTCLNLLGITDTSSEATSLSNLVTCSDLHVICHGTRNGAELRYFQSALPGCTVLGTDISHTATQFDNTIQHDFHEPLPAEHTKQATIVYSNSLDHAYDAAKALQAWLDQASEPDHENKGIVVVEHSSDDLPERVNALDCCGISFEHFISFVEQNTTGKVIYTAPAPVRPSNTGKDTQTMLYFISPT